MSNVKHGPEHVKHPTSTEELTHGSPYIGPDAPEGEQPMTGTVIQAWGCELLRTRTRLTLNRRAESARMHAHPLYRPRVRERMATEHLINDNRPLAPI